MRYAANPFLHNLHAAADARDNLEHSSLVDHELLVAFGLVLIHLQVLKDLHQILAPDEDVSDRVDLVEDLFEPKLVS